MYQEKATKMDHKTSTCVISICSLNHADVWKLTSTLLPKHIEATTYKVYVPDMQIDEFKKITNSRIEIYPQSTLTEKFIAPLAAAISYSGNMSRFGWYYQQFLKFEALFQAREQRLVIWDADCVPLAPIKLFSNFGQPTYMRAKEFHTEYFNMIERLLKIKRVVDTSFVIPGFPITKEWYEELISNIEAINNTPWYEAMIKNTNFELTSGFSETEIMGTWVSNVHNSDIAYSNYNWERLGQSKIGYAKDLSVDEVERIGKSRNIQIVSFENWDLKRRWVKKVESRIRRRKIGND
jgi:hypothetical protein